VYYNADLRELPAQQRRLITMLSKTVEDALNEQIKWELYSAYFYLSMSAHCESINFKGFARWLRKQSREEVSHAMKLFDHINDRQGRVVLQTISQPPKEFKSLLDVFQQVLNHEQEVTGMINQLYELTVNENDYATRVMLHWFIEEQVEEEKMANEVLSLLKMVGEQPADLLMLDRQMGARAGG
jgi:ferritin